MKGLKADSRTIVRFNRKNVKYYNILEIDRVDNLAYDA